MADPPAAPYTPRRHEVLGVPLLLETIPLNLDTRTLLVSAQRINKAFRTFIKNTRSLQIALFFRWAPSPTRIPNPLFHLVKFHQLSPNACIDEVNFLEGKGSVSKVETDFDIDVDAWDEPMARGSWRRMLLMRDAQEYDATVRWCVHSGLEREELGKGTLW